MTVFVWLPKTPPPYEFYELFHYSKIPILSILKIVGTIYSFLDCCLIHQHPSKYILDLISSRLVVAHLKLFNCNLKIEL